MLGFPFLTHCTQANVTDDPGLIEMLSLNIDDFKAKPVNIPNITILIDHGYHLNLIIVALQVAQIMTKVRFERSPKPSKAEKRRWANRGLCLWRPDGWWNARMPGWNAVKVW